MLYLHQSNQLERLAHHFAALQRIDPLSPLTHEMVVVQNSGMGRWLSLQTARFNGISANIRYLFPAEMTWELLRAVLSDVPEKDPCAPASLRWRLLTVFLQEPDEWPELNHYLATGAAGVWQLAGQIAKVFDQYLFFRPDWIREWEAGGSAVDDWQVRLWWRVAGAQKLPHWVRLQARFAAAMQQGAHTGSPLPTRISFFSVPVLSPGYVQLLTQVAQYIDIHVYLMNPSIEYWGDIESEKRRRKQSPEAQALTMVGNPLLASWGRQGRDFLDQLLEANAETDDTLFVETDETTLLQQLQADILHLRMPSLLPAPLGGEGLGKGGKYHSSIAFHSCHSPLREAEVLYQQLVKLLSENDDLTPADIVIMMPDIDTYAPYLDAVFATADPPLPYSIADGSPRFTQGMLNLCQQLLGLPQTRCDVESVLALLEFEEVREHLAMDEAQVMQCRAWMRAVNVRWGADTRMRDAQGGAVTLEHTWRYGLDRLLLGYALPGTDLFADVLPFNDIEGSLALLLARLQQLLDAVLGLAAWQGQTHPLAVWDQRLRQVLHAVVGETANLSMVWQALDQLKKTVMQADFAEPLAWEIFQAALLEQLDKRSEADGFLGRGITFCALMPMRTVPFRFVGIIGMNDGVFPRRDTRASFDRMGLQVRRGDRLKRDEDRYLFLESVLSAREWLYISYVGQSQQDNSELPPSVLVSELLDYLERCGATREALITKHRLQEWENTLGAGDNSEAVWGGESWQFLPPPDPHYRQLALSDLIRFYQHPARYFLQERFGLRLGERDESLPVREPFELEKFSDATLREVIFQCVSRGQAAETALPLLRAQGLLPHGTPGALLFGREVSVTQDFFERVQPLPVLQQQSFYLELGEFSLSGVLGQLDSSGRREYVLGKLSYWQWLEIWLQHLVLNALPESTYGRHTQVLGVEKDVQLLPVEDAAAQLEQLLAWYWRGLQQPLAFFPKTAFEMAKLDAPTPAQATTKWESSYGYAGEGDKPEYRLLYRHENPLETHWDEFLEITQGLFKAMLGHSAPLAPCGRGAGGEG